MVAACGSLGGSRCAGGRSSGLRAPGAALAGDGVAVVDGDTIHVDLDGRTPRSGSSASTPRRRTVPTRDEECFGQEATRYTEQALAGREVELEFDVDRTDRYDRTLAYVWIGYELFDERILEDGYAVLLTVPPNVRYVDRLTQAQRAGRDAGAGLWGACPGG